MELKITVSTIGDKYCFSFCAGCELDYIRIAIIGNDDEAEYFDNIRYEDIDNPQVLDWDYIRTYLDDGTLEEAFWEEMNGNPEWEIIELMKDSHEYSKLQDMSKEELEAFVIDFVAKTLISTEMTYEIDEIDVTEMAGSQKGAWDDMVFNEISNSVMYQLEKCSNRYTG